MARRIFHQTRMYDYTTLKEAKQHIVDMIAKNWNPRIVDENEFGSARYIKETFEDTYKYTVEFYKEL